MKVNWGNFEKSAKLLKKNVKNIAIASELLTDFPGEGLFKNKVSVNGVKETRIVKIVDCKSSTLRRFIRELDNCYYLVSDEKDKQLILNKKIEIETELGNRPDGIIEKK